MRPGVLVYLAGPITAKGDRSIEQNVAAALTVHFWLVARGVPTFCPQLTALSPSAHLTIPYEVWIEYDKRIIERCTHVLMLPHWETSKGARWEFDHAKDLGLPIYFTASQVLAALGPVSQ